MTVASIVAVALPLLANPASAATYHEEIEFATTHNCTGEPVEGDTKVRITVDTTENSDGTTTVKTKQHTVGSQLRGLISNDKYTFNNSEDVEETATLFCSAGHIKSRTVFVHSSEDVAYTEQPGMDDFHQHFTMTFAPLLPPVLTKDKTECK
ncbi:MAG TPA: hypothetical protein VEU29_04285 [Actinomycetota bacterium]|nr:hypothetical protein [Actinomycetota bacterium]